MVPAAPQLQGGYASASFPADDAGWGAADTRGGGDGDGWGYDDDSGAPGSDPYQARRALNTTVWWMRLLQAYSITTP